MGTHGLSQLARSNARSTLGRRQTAVTGWTYYGCQTEGTNGRALSGKSTAYDTMTLESCASDCAGYTYFGTEYGRECEHMLFSYELYFMLMLIGYCGDSLNAGSAVAPKSDCSFACGGNASELCGAGNRLSVYQEGAGGETSGTTTTPPKSTSTPASPSGPAPQKTGLPAGWAYAGCLQYVI